MMRTRAEHLAWCKERALAYVDRGDPGQALISMTSDLQKHPETRDHSAIMLQTMLIMGGHLSKADEVRTWIEGFN